MTQQASLSEVSPHLARVRLRLPFAGPVMLKMMAGVVVCLFVISSGMLNVLGWDYSSTNGTQLAKIHISTYWVVLTFVVFLATYPDKRGLLDYYFSTTLGALYFFGATSVTLLAVVIGKRNGLGMYLDTHLNLFCCFMMLPFVPPLAMNRLEMFLHWFFLVNALTGLTELALGIRFFPLVDFDGNVMTWETRSNGFLGHPLEDAALTSVYIVGLLVGGGAMLRKGLRAPMIVLQMAALVAFGGRTALLMTGAVLTLFFLWRLLQFGRGRKFSYTSVMTSALAIPLGVVALAILTYLGFFDQFLARFVEDGGSARARFQMLDLLASFRLRDLLVGADPDFITAQRFSYGLEWGVENPFIHMIIYQGGIFAAFIISGYFFLLRDAYVRLKPTAILPMAVFMILCSSFESFGGRFFAFSTFIIIVSTLFRRENLHQDYVT